jgi:hypothetical protein
VTVLGAFFILAGIVWVLRCRRLLPVGDQIAPGRAKELLHSAFLRGITLMICRALFSWLRALAQRIIDWRISKHGRV